MEQNESDCLDRPTTIPDEDPARSPTIPKNLHRRRFFLPDRSFDDYHALCKEIGHAPADVALAWVAQQPGIRAPIVGPRTMEQFEGNLGALEIELEEETLKRLGELFPGPGGAAPEAYAW